MGQDRHRYKKTPLDLELGCRKVVEKVNAQVSYCDIVMKVLIEGTAFYSSRLILGAWSPYFERIFTCVREEITKREVVLKGVSKICFIAIWEFLHGTEFSIDGEDGLLAILRDAHFLSIMHLCEIVSRMIGNALQVQNAFLFLRTAQDLQKGSAGKGPCIHSALLR